MPVDQTGETIVFAQGGGFVEAHVQINYDGGDADQFSWIVPVPVVPEIEVGSLAFINSLRTATVPSYGIVNGTNECDGGATGLSTGFITDPDGGGVSIDPGVDVIELSTAGSFEYAILQGGTSTTMMQWLEANGYAPNPLAPDLFDAYINEGSVFVAFRLRHLAGIEDLHPVVIRYEGDEPCIPLRLTAVAAKEDMDIRAIFLGESRVLPTNYRHVRLNNLQLNWLQQSPNYRDVVSAALDEAGGRGFVTEYAGNSSVVDPTPVDASLFDPDAFIGADPLSVVEILKVQGLVICTDTCEYTHELIPVLLREFFPAPTGIDPNTLYACLSCYERLVDLSGWDEAAFIQRYREYISGPMDHATDLLETWPYLTRLYSRISPSEMTTDPMFAEVEGLGPIPNILGAQRNTDACCNDSVVLPDGATVRLNAGNWPGWGKDMPNAAVIQQYQPGGPPADEVNNLAAINAALNAHNQAVKVPQQCDGETDGPMGSTGTEGDSGVLSGGGSTSGPATSDSASPAGDTSSGAAPGALDDDGGCRSGGGGSGWLATLLGIALAATRRRRR